MGAFVLGRLSQTVLALAVFALVVFGLSRASGDPVRLMVPLDTPQETLEIVRRNLGLDRPIPVQILIFYRDILSGDFGTSLRSKLPVRQLVLDRLPASLQLGGFSMALAIIFALPLSVAAAARRNSLVDRSVRVVAGFGLAVPSFFLGIVLIGFFAVFLRILPAGESGDLQHLILPGFTLALSLSANLIRLLRASLLEVVGEQYVLTARGKGLRESAVMWRHVLRNALLPVVTFAGTYVIMFVSSAVVVETVFAWPGIGRLALEAVQGRDYPVMQGLMLMTAALAAVVNLVIDVLYVVLDPRVRLS